jgi:PAS domain S-box-containing protein
MHKILAIDDKMDNLVTLSALLKNLMPDCVVITAQSGTEGIAKANAERPDAILLDVKMPDMDGFETCRRLMADESTKRIPVIMMTAIKTDSESRIKGLEVGANTFLAKPIDEAELVSQVKVALRIKKAEDALREERDSLERKVRERTADLRESEEKFSKAFQTSPYAIIITRPKDGKFLEVNDAFISITGFTREETLAGSSIGLKLWFNEDDRQSVVNALQAGRAVVGEEFLFRTKGGEVITGLFSAQTIHLGCGPYILSSINDITERKQSEQKLKNTLESLRKAVSATIQVMVSAVETRDPYTSGHQIRSANLARTIAAEMKLSQDQIDAIRMAGAIHDIGKLSIPAEILSKPTKLSEIEFSLIKEHARQGWEILGNVESPWPLAEMVYQHHERMDGSGYPRNLKGDAILIEARILAVADVVESMASHRPYRPALGIDKALEEIKKNSGTLYDDTVVEVCLRLFREKGFQF